MDETFIVDLPPEVSSMWFNVYAPDGGLEGPLLALREGRSANQYLDLDVRHGKKCYGILRIYPGSNISPDLRNPFKFYVSDGVAVFLDELGNEHSGNLSFGGHLEVEAIHVGSLTGELNLWRQELPEFHAAS